MKTISKLILTSILAVGSVNLCAFEKPECIEDYSDKIPGIGLICDRIKFDGITVSDFHFENDKKYIFVEAGQDVQVHFNYEIDASKLNTLHLSHLIIGLHDDGPQKCVISSLGIKDAEGTAKLSIKAPEEAGAYQVRFCLSEGLTDEQAMKAWWKGEGPSAKTIVGIVVVK